ncbi:MAG: DNA-binding protein [Cyanobacteria bacterium P01_G01_bin.39]
MYVNTTQAASLLKISSSRLRQLLQKGRVRGAYKSGKFWLIPIYRGMPQIVAAKRGQAGTWKTVRKLKKTIVHINSNRIKQNIKKSKTERKPAIAVRGKEKHYVHELEIPVPCKIIYNPDKPLDCGARVWIEILNFDLDLIAG